MNNILTAIEVIVENSTLEVINNSEGTTQNRANQMGEAFENYVKDAFAGCLGKDTRTIMQARNKPSRTWETVKIRPMQCWQGVTQ